MLNKNLFAPLPTPQAICSYAHLNSTVLGKLPTLPHARYTCRPGWWMDLSEDTRLVSKSCCIEPSLNPFWGHFLFIKVVFRSGWCGHPYPGHFRPDLRWECPIRGSKGLRDPQPRLWKRFFSKLMGDPPTAKRPPGPWSLPHNRLDHVQ